MIGVLVVLAIAAVVLALVNASMVRSFQRERESWTAERKALVDRAIARHSGEVMAMDRNDRKAHPPQERETRLVEGLT